MKKPKRIQWIKGCRMPKNTVYVGRFSRFDNPFRLIPNSVSHTREGIVQLYAETIARNETDLAKWINAHLNELHGKDLACRCPCDVPCHADVLLKLAND